MKVLIRVEAGGIHGLGHAVRCRALARMLAAAGVEVCFLTDTPALSDFVAPLPVQCIPLSGGQSVVLDCNVLVMDVKTTPLQEQSEAPVFYAMREAGIRVVRIDHPDATSETCDLLIAPVAHWEAPTVSRLRAAFGERFLYGWDYVMLDDTVTAQEPLPYEERQDGPLVFCAGGSDPSGVLQTMYNWTTALVLEPPTNLIFVQGMYAPRLRWHQHAMPHAIVEGTRYHEMLRHAALVVGMFGVSCYETAWWQTPMLCAARTPEDGKAAWSLWHTSDHQVWPLNSPDLEQWDALGFCATLADIMADRQWRQEMADGSVGLLDGRGVQRVAEAILGLGA